jgi:multicomponent K+:H+ antiporter subunit D
VTTWLDHLIIAPIIIPLFAALIMMLIGEQRRPLKAALGLFSALSLVAISVALLVVASIEAEGPGTARVYRLGDWPAIFAIVLVLDRLAALMVFLSSLLGFAALLFSLARWHRAGTHFHPLLQLQLMGLNGAFLTGDIFNLFVFFEVMLAASYGLALHGSGIARVKAGLHYIAINLVTSFLILIGASVIYGIAGTLNMADLAIHMGSVSPGQRSLLEVGLAVLGIAFLVKAAIWPLGFWLPYTYAAASAPCAAVISLLSKVGIYAILRLWLLVFGADAMESSGFGSIWLLFGGLATVLFGSIAIMATQSLSRLAGASIFISSGTLLAAISTGEVGVTGGALYYLCTSVLAIAALYLLIELIERGRVLGADVLAVTREAYGEGEPDEYLDEEEEVGIAIPATMAILGLSFAGCALLLAGLPPLSGFLGKFAILSPLLSGENSLSPASWGLLGALTVSGIATVIATSRAGVEAFWASPPETVPQVNLVEIAPIFLLLGLCIAITVMAGPTMQYMEATAQYLHSPMEYARGVFPTPAKAAGGG